MIPMNYDESSYTPLLQYDDLDHCAKTEYTVRRIRRLQSFAAAIGFVLLLTFSVIVLSPYEQIFDLQSMQSTGAESDKSLLSSCSARSEWRQLSPNQQEDYITAVRCLLSRPAQVQGSASRYLDWATTYRQAGYRTWYGAEFLPWHRYFIHLFETALREECAYTGSLPYWDWTIGLDNLPQNPVAFTLASLLNDHTDTAASIIRRERPMRDVSFPEIELQTKAAGLSALLPPGGSTYDQDKPVDIDDYGLNKDSVKQLMRQTDFEAFSAELQKYLHDTIRYGIGGDFDTPIAPKGTSSRAPNRTVQADMFRPFIFPASRAARSPMDRMAGTRYSQPCRYV